MYSNFCHVLSSFSEPNKNPQTIIFSPKPTVMVVEKKRRYGRLIFFLAIAILFIYTNPNEKMHLDFVRETLRNNVEKESGSPIFTNLFELIVGEQTINNYLNNYIKRKNFVFFSVTEIQIKGEWEILTIGVLGNFHIYMWDKVKGPFVSR